MQTEELYEEILYEILHNVGCETENVTCQTTLYSYIQDAFKVISVDSKKNVFSLVKFGPGHSIPFYLLL